MSAQRRVIIVGASSGIGAALARLLARRGWAVALVARREKELTEVRESIPANRRDRVRVYTHDVLNTAEVPSLFQEITRAQGGFDTIIYCAGVMPPVAIDEYNFDKDKLVFDVNVLGGIAWLNEAAKRCEAGERGTIVGISSVAGDRGRIGQPVYCASKAAFTTYLEGLRNRLGNRGSRVLTIKPGPVSTPMTEGLKLPLMISAEKAALLIAKAMRSKQQTVYVPLVWWPIMTVIKLLPSFILRGKKI